MRWIPFPLALSIALAGGAGLAADSPLRPEDLGRAMGLRLGEWRTVSKIVDADVEAGAGIDPADVERVAAILRAKIGETRTETQCLSKDSKDLYLPGFNTMPECAFGRVEARKGRFAMAATCKARTGSARIAAEGTYASGRLAARSEASVATPEGIVRMKFESESLFAGKCESAPTIVLPPGTIAVPPIGGD